MAAVDISADFEVFTPNGVAGYVVEIQAYKGLEFFWPVYSLNFCKSGDTGGEGVCPDERPDTGMLYPRG